MSIRTEVGPFSIVPEWLLEVVGPRAVQLYALLARYADRNGESFPSRTTLASRLDCSVDTIDRTIAELEKSGALRVTRRTNAGGSKLTNLYLLAQVRPPTSNDAATPSRKDAATWPQGRGIEREPLNENQRKESSASKPSASQRAALPPRERFFQSQNRGAQVGALVDEAKAHGHSLTGGFAAQMLKDHDKAAVWNALMEAQRTNPGDYGTYMKGVLNNGRTKQVERPSTGADSPFAKYE